jgi:hypothetical protein
MQTRGDMYTSSDDVYGGCGLAMPQGMPIRRTSGMIAATPAGLQDYRVNVDLWAVGGRLARGASPYLNRHHARHTA